MRKKHVFYLLGLFLATSSLVGCTKTKEPTFEDKVKINVGRAVARINELEFQIKEMSTQIDILKRQTGTASTEISADKLKFQSIQVLTSKGSVKGDTGKVEVKGDSTFDVKMEILNISDINANNFICQVILDKYSGNEFIDKYYKDVQVSILPQSIKKDILITNIPIAGKGYQYKLTVKIKDSNGNDINVFEKELSAI